jgi:hypothetical protein
MKPTVRCSSAQTKAKPLADRMASAMVFSDHQSRQNPGTVCISHRMPGTSERIAARSILLVCDTVRPTARTGLRSAGHFCKAELGHFWQAPKLEAGSHVLDRLSGSPAARQKVLPAGSTGSKTTKHGDGRARRARARSRGRTRKSKRSQRERRVRN